MTKFSNLLLVLFIFVSCTSKERKNEKNDGLHPVSEKQEILQIDPRKFEDNELTLSGFAADVEYIPLSNKLQIGSIQVLKVTSNAVYLIYDSSGGGEGNGHPQLFRFDKNGKNPVQI